MPRKSHPERNRRRKSLDHVFERAVTGGTKCARPDCQAVWYAGEKKPKTRCPEIKK